MLYSCPVGVRNEVIEATLRVIAADGFRAVTIRRIAKEVGRSTSAITHYFADRDELLRETVQAALTDRRACADSVSKVAEDPVWAFLEWSIDADPVGVWAAVMAASAAGIEPEIVEQARAFDEWWGTHLARLLEGRCPDGIDPMDVVQAIGIAVDGLLVGIDASRADVPHRHRLLHLLVDPLVRPLGPGRDYAPISAASPPVISSSSS